MICRVRATYEFLIEASDEDAAEELISDLISEIDHPQFLTHPDEESCVAQQTRGTL